MRKISIQKMWSNIHQSYFVVWWCIGMIFGVVLGLVFRINYFASPWWCAFSILLMVWVYLRPKYLFVVLAFISGMFVAFFRVSGEAMQLETNEYVLMVRDFFAGRIRGLVPEPEVSLGLSYLLGMKSGLPSSLSESLRTVGLTHIVVASGAHLAILVEVARKVFGKISRFSGLFFATFFIVFFMAMVGWTPSILRAGMMAILNLVAWYVGRKIAAWRLILMVAALTLVINPELIISLSWQLSFASFGGIMVLGPKLTKYFYGEKKPGIIGETVLTTIAATLMTLPITLYYFGQVSLISVVANLLILPTLPYAMGLAFLTGLFAGFPGVEMVVSFLTTKLLDFHIFVVELFGEWTQFLIKTPQYQVGVFLLYLPIVLLMVSSEILKKRKKRMV